MNNKKMYEVLTEQWGDSDNYVNDLLHYTKSLEKEIKGLKNLYENMGIAFNNAEQRIDKAIEYAIKENDRYLLELLKGK